MYGYTTAETAEIPQEFHAAENAAKLVILRRRHGKYAKWTIGADDLSQPLLVTPLPDAQGYILTVRGIPPRGTAIVPKSGAPVYFDPGCSVRLRRIEARVLHNFIAVWERANAAPMGAA